MSGERAPTPPPKSPPLTQSTLDFMVSLSHASRTQGEAGQTQELSQTTGVGYDAGSNSSQVPLLAQSLDGGSTSTLQQPQESGVILMQPAPTSVPDQHTLPGNIMFIQNANGSMIPVVSEPGFYSAPPPVPQEHQPPPQQQQPVIFMPMNSPMLGELPPHMQQMAHQEAQQLQSPKRLSRMPAHRDSMSFPDPAAMAFANMAPSPKSPKSRDMVLRNAPAGIAGDDARSLTRAKAKRRLSYASSDKSRKLTLASFLCCCCKSRASRWACALMTILFLVAVGVVGYLFFPRPPQFKVISLMVASGTGRDPLNFKQNDPNDRLNFTLSLDLTMDVSFYNDNRYMISVEEIDLSAYLTPNVTQLLNSGLGGTDNLKNGTTVNGRKVGFGKRTNLNFPSYATTNFTMAITLSYTPDPKTGLFGDITFSEFFQACGLANTPRRSMRVDYSAEVIIASLTKLGFKPVFADKVNINCPFSKDSLERIYGQLGMPLPATVE